MKFTPLFAVAFVSSAAFAQETVTVTTGAGNGTQTYYSLLNGDQGTAPLASWDLAFEISGFTSSILVNTAKGLTAFETPVGIDDWATLITPDEAGWTPIYNAETDWSEGALTHGNNLSQPEGVDVGWGEYNMVTHTIAGTKIYVIKLADESYKKLRINSLMSGTYSFTYADLDGANEQTASLVKNTFTGKNFGYFDLASGTTQDLEPPTAEWDLLFTKYTAMVPMPAPTPYGVVGVLQNKNVAALQIDGVDTDLADWTSAPFDTTMNIIGSDWKTYDMANNQYVYAQDRTYFVEDLAGNVWKLIFSAYGGAATGDITFTKELMSATGIEEAALNTGLVLYPNPAQSGRTNVLLERGVTKATLSVIDASGKLALQQPVMGSGALSSVALDLSGLAKGLYLVRLDAMNGTSTTRLLVD